MNGQWFVLFETNYREGMPVPNKGFIVNLPGYDNDFEVTKVTFNLRSSTIEIEISKLYGTES
jgi:hypothetical protein